MKNNYALIKSAKLTKSQMTFLGLKKPKGLPAGSYVYPMNNMLCCFTKKGRILQYENNRGNKTDLKTGRLKLRNSDLDRIRKEFDPLALGHFGFSLRSDGKLKQTIGHHRLVICEEKKKEGFDFKGFSVIVSIVDEESHILQYTRDGEQKNHTVGQRVGNTDLIYGHYYNKTVEKLRKEGIKVTATNLPKSQFSQTVEVMFSGDSKLFRPENYIKVYEGRKIVKEKSNTPLYLITKKGRLLTKEEEFHLFDASKFLLKVLQNMKNIPIPLDAVASLTNLAIFRGFILNCRAGLTKKEIDSRASTKVWATQPPERLAVRIAANAQSLRRETQLVTSGAQPEQQQAIFEINRILNKKIRNEVVIGKQIINKNVV